MTIRKKIEKLKEVRDFDVISMDGTSMDNSSYRSYLVNNGSP